MDFLGAVGIYTLIGVLVVISALLYGGGNVVK